MDFNPNEWATFTCLLIPHGPLALQALGTTDTTHPLQGFQTLPKRNECDYRGREFGCTFNDLPPGRQIV